MQQTIFENCPTFENEKLSLKRTILADMIDLLKVYSDKKAVLLFNSDNCDGDDFYYNNFNPKWTKPFGIEIRSTKTISCAF
ncbi:hypothetical protein [Liquorilactobacillus satsumensis]|uniref:hypothetical protein n=1 Tax=Liquorilactobacillus satsumensis TaxID=259059 RepID=UPI0021C282EE|nr:hypothetical protein [Liquorilactobacillus satsumensis]MCP9327906.1 hypothetical protein [Liquorilactobacillus satsumensis]